MAQVHITLPDGSVKDFDKEVTGYDLAKSISPRLAKEAVAVKVNGSVQDLNRNIPDGAPVNILTFNDPEGREVFWHSSSHIMAQAVQDLAVETGSELIEQRPGRPWADVDHDAFLGVVQRGQEQHLGFALREPVVGIGPDVEEPSRRPGS